MIASNGAFAGDRREPVAESKVDAVGHAELGGVRRATARASLADVDRDEPRRVVLVTPRRSPGSPSRSRRRRTRGDSSWLGQRQELDDHELRLGPRDQHGGRDREGQRVELLAADEVGHRRTLGAAADQLAKAARARPRATSSSKWV